MKNKPIGKKEIFAIEYTSWISHSINPIGPCKLWFDGHFIGDTDNEVFLISTYQSLKDMEKQNILPENIPNLPISSAAFLALMEGDEIPNIGRYYFLAIEGYDHFLKLFFNTGRSLVIFSSLHPQVEGYPEYQNYPLAPKRAEIDVHYFSKVVDQFGQAISDLEKKEK